MNENLSIAAAAFVRNVRARIDAMENSNSQAPNVGWITMRVIETLTRMQFCRFSQVRLQDLQLVAKQLVGNVEYAKG